MPGGEASGADLLSVRILEGWSLSVQVALWPIPVLLALAGAYFVYTRGGFMRRNFDIDRAELGIGTGKLHLKPNTADRQVAYEIWVELSTRKIGLAIDFENDVIDEVYSSWYKFFSVTRDHIKSIPANKLDRGSTKAIVDLSIAVLNEGLRPHLTRWQARFRWWWHSPALTEERKSSTFPQEFQKQFPEYEELVTDMKKVNQQLMGYRKAMYGLATAGRREKP